MLGVFFNFFLPNWFICYMCSTLRQSVRIVCQGLEYFDNLVIVIFINLGNKVC